MCMTTTATLRKWGNSIALVLPDTLVKAEKLATGNEVEIHMTDRKIEIRKAMVPSKIESLCAAITAENLHSEPDWGIPQGQEVW